MANEKFISASIQRIAETARLASLLARLHREAELSAEQGRYVMGKHALLMREAIAQLERLSAEVARLQPYVEAFRREERRADREAQRADDLAAEHDAERASDRARIENGRWHEPAAIDAAPAA